MRKSRVLREVRSGEQSTCLKINITHPNVVELAGLAGASAVWLCCEHVPSDWSVIEHCVRAAKIHDMDAIVRVSKGAYSDYIKPFEADAAGIMVPHVESAAEAARVVDMCRFRPLGHRALDGGNVDGEFCQIPMKEYIEASNREKFIILQIESPEAIENIDEIAAVSGYDFLLFGPGDYSHRVGVTGEVQHPEVKKARIRVEEAARAHGKYLFSVGAGGTAAEQFDRGYVIANFGSDVFSLGKAFTEAISQNRQAAIGSNYQKSYYDRSF